MSDAQTGQEACSAPSEVRELDALVIGAGVAGLYQLYLLREQGLKVLACDTASGVGGTWYWNRYPGARFDSESYIYQYLFSEALYKGWTWSQRFPGQAEIERWMSYVAECLDLRRDIRFNTRVTSARFDEDTRRWIVTSAEGAVFDTRFLVTCCGMLSAPLTSVFPGQDSFEGEILHTARWPRDSIDLAGKRVGVVGIGATGIQVIQTIAGEVAHLKVFVRTPQYVLPMRNPSYGPREAEAYKARFEELRDTLPHTFTGFEYDFENTWAELAADRRHALLEEIYRDGSLKLWLASFAELFFDEEVSEEISEFVRGKMRARLRYPRLCELLIPTDYGFGSRRVPLETNYLEAYLRPNVEAVGVRDNPIQRVTPQGIETADGTLHELDAIILATGFDAGTGALTRIDIRGRGGRSLAGDWGRDIRTTLGLQVHGYPNLFTTAAPLAPSAALCNMTTCPQQQAEWISDCIRRLHERNCTVIEPTREMEDRWVARDRQCDAHRQDGLLVCGRQCGGQAAPRIVLRRRRRRLSPQVR